jgi:hypothetical protein
MSPLLTQYGHWTVVGADETGKRITCRCRCGAVHVVALDALDDGTSSSCGCRPLSRRQRSNRAAEQKWRQLQFDFGGGQS